MAKCGQKTEIYSRVVGYFRPVADWNKGKKEEFKDRKTYLANSAVKGCKVA
ncbi:MAG: anaerobic ribonucleoside-triphosphate reductase [Victivallaceae bacterium]|jgi:ribonucleoside-triphosphate reductase